MSVAGPGALAKSTCRHCTPCLWEVRAPRCAHFSGSLPKLESSGFSPRLLHVFHYVTQDSCAHAGEWEALCSVPVLWACRAQEEPGLGKPTATRACDTALEPAATLPRGLHASISTVPPLQTGKVEPKREGRSARWLS